MSSPAKDYFLLKEPAPGHRIFDLLGRAVYIEGDSLKSPTEAIIIPELPKVGPKTGPNLKKLVPSLYPKHIKAENVEVLLSKARNESARLAVSKLVDIFYTHSRASAREKTIPGFRRITMEEQPRKIEELLNNNEYNSPIIDLFGKFPEAKLGIIVSIISCFQMEVGNKKSEQHAGGAAAKVPGEALGAPGGVGDLKAEGKADSSTESELSGTYKDEVIMACAYVEMRLKENPNRGWQFWKSNKPTIHDITFTKAGISPVTMTVSVPPARIKGDQEAILGGIDESDDAGAENAATSDSLEDQEDESDFVLYA